MKRKFKDAKLKNKIIVVFSSILLLNMVITSGLYYYYMNKDTVNNFRNNSTDMVSQINTHLNEKFMGISNKVNAVGNNLSFLEPLKTYLSDSSNQDAPIFSGTVADMISEVKMSDDFISSMYLHTPKGIFDDYILPKKQGVNFEDTPMYRYFVYSPWKTIGWLPSTENFLYYDSEETIPIVYRQRVANHNVYFVVNISPKSVKDYLKNTFRSFDRIFIVSEEGENILNYGQVDEEIVTAFADDEIPTDNAICREVSLENKNYYVTTSKMKGNGWQIYALTSVDSLTGNLQKLRMYLAAGWLLSIGVCLAAILSLSKTLTVPIEQLAVKMEHVVEDNFYTEFEYPYGDEIGRLAKNFNYMVEEILEHIKALEAEKEQVKKIQTQKRKIELLALQAQINPHFLYNTLNMITWQAVDQGAEEISIMSNALGKYFRISLSKGKEIIPLYAELDHVKSYLEIQKLRYKDKLNFEFSIPEELGHYYVIKLILQPLVENALYHGIKGKEGTGTIRLYAKQDQNHDLEITIEDDGLGMERDKLLALNQKLRAAVVDSENGYGIYNVNNRLMLYYGQGYGLYLESCEGGGTKSIVKLPAVETEGVMEDVPDYSGRG